MQDKRWYVCGLCLYVGIDLWSDVDWTQLELKVICTVIIAMEKYKLAYW